MRTHRKLCSDALILLALGLCIVCVGIRPGAAIAAPPAGKPLAYLTKSVGVEPYSLLKTAPLSTRLKALLGAQEYAAFIHNMDPAQELTNTNGILSTCGNAEHMGGEEEGILLIDPEHDVIEVILMHGGKTVRAWAEKNTPLALPASVSQTLEHWPQPALKAALAKLAAPAAKGAGSAATK